MYINEKRIELEILTTYTHILGSVFEQQLMSKNTFLSKHFDILCGHIYLLVLFCQCLFNCYWPSSVHCFAKPLEK